MENRYVKRARAILGVRFRPQGRTPAEGLDCVGVLVCVFEIDASLVRRNYRLRGNHAAELRLELARHFRRVATTKRRPGDVMLLGVSRDQLHLAICTAGGFIHADAAIGRVVETPGDPPWPFLGIYRRRRLPTGEK